ncbi:MAG: T9SS type A sorting domain-containing protein [candidate division KSB1 bacterium]|nr:T9SS type A sorting domain-containing protein [candidate division KSB1 bacterium]
MKSKFKGMGKLPVILAAVLLLMQAPAFAEVTPASFVKPPSNYDPMNIFFKGFNYYGLMPKAGDKVGVFDGELCVGVTILQKDYSQYEKGEFLFLTAYKEFKQNNVVVDPGFREGNPMKFYLLVSATNTVVAIPDSNVAYYNTETGEKLSEPVTFTGRGTALVEIHSGMAKLSIRINPAGKGNTIPKADDYLYSINDAQQVTIRIDSTAFAEHYEFSHWLIDDTQTITAPQVTVTMIKNTKVEANFKLKKYTLTPVVDPAQGSTTPATPTEYTALTYADIFAKANEGTGYEFSHWVVSPPDVQIENPNQASTRVLMTKNVQVTAVFKLEKDSLLVTITPAQGGNTIPEPGVMHVYTYGQTVTVTALPNPGYKFKHWLEYTGLIPSIVSTDSIYSFIIRKSTRLEAVFEKKKYLVQLRTQDYMGIIQISLDQGTTYQNADSLYTFEYGTIIKLRAVSHDAVKYPFDNWSGAVNSTENPITVTVTTNMLIICNFFDTTPVELAAFTVQFAPHSVSRAVLLRWETVSETNNLGFEVERAMGAEKNWQRIGFVKGAGTTTRQQTYQFIDTEALEVGVYFYRLRQLDTDGTFSYSQTVKFEVTAPLDYALMQNFPNPFNPTTTIVFQLKESGYATLQVYDLLGRRVMTLVDGELKAGTHKITLDASELSPGIYFYSLNAGSFKEMKKMTLIK